MAFSVTKEPSSASIVPLLFGMLEADSDSVAPLSARTVPSFVNVCVPVLISSGFVPSATIRPPFVICVDTEAQPI